MKLIASVLLLALLVAQACGSVEDKLTCDGALGLVKQLCCCMLSTSPFPSITYLVLAVCQAVYSLRTYSGYSLQSSNQTIRRNPKLMKLWEKYSAFSEIAGFLH